MNGFRRGFRAKSPLVLLAAALQHYKPTYQLGDFGQSGLDRHYLPLAQQALQEEGVMVVLEEQAQQLDPLSAVFMAMPSTHQITALVVAEETAAAESAESAEGLFS